MTHTPSSYISEAVARAEKLGAEGWRLQAACRGMDSEVFFPSRGDDAAQAKAVCASCPVREPCLEYALVAGEKFGVFGGKSENERRRMRVARNVA